MKSGRLSNSNHKNILHPSDRNKIHGYASCECHFLHYRRRKTQSGSLVGSHNCNADTALQEMLATKRKFGKMDKRQGYHFIISFKKQEVRPETAMEITQKFVERYFRDDFQCLYATHDNTEHVHSHILFNSISRRTRRKYRYEKGDWAREIQPIVNELCREYGLSIQDIEVGTEEKSLKKWDKTKQGIFKWNHQISLRQLSVALKEMGLLLNHCPEGCFANGYHWNIVICRLCTFE